MPFSRPTLTTLRGLAIQDITTSGVPGLTGLLRNAVLRVLAWSMAGLAYGVYGYADWIARMGVPFTAEDEFLYAWAALIGVYPKDATPAHGHAQFIGLPGIVLPLGTALTRQDGTPYQTTGEATVGAAGNVLVPMVALVSGAYTNCPDNSPINIARPITGINSGGLTVGPTIGGADQEDDASTRNRMLAKYRAPPQGGALSDYLLWALEVPGVTRSWCMPLGYGPGTVIVYPMFDEANASNGGFPQGSDGVATDEDRGNRASGDQLDVADHIYPLRPVTALVYVVAPLPHPVDVTLIELEPNTAQIQASIRASLVDMFLAYGEVAGTVYPSMFYEAISATPGVRRFAMTIPAGPVTAPPGALPIMGTLSAPALE